MAKRTAVKKSEADGPNPRQACPCGSGRRYKACHGSAYGAVETATARPFAGLAAEAELVALKEFVPSATVELPLLNSDAKVTLATVLPLASAALLRADGLALVGTQVLYKSTDIGKDLARAIDWVQSAELGGVLQSATEGKDLVLADLIDPKAELVPTLHDDFNWWVPQDREPNAEVDLSLERANAAIMPTDRLQGDGVRAAYWVNAGSKAHLRWVRPEPEDQLLDALARLAHRGQLDLGEGSRFAGSFRAHGVLVPVWDLDVESHAREWDKPAQELGARLDEALASIAVEPLTDSERPTRYGLIGRQITLR